MKTVLTMIVLAILCAVVSSHPASGQASGAQAADPAPKAIHESPFACDRLALDPEARKRHFEELGPALRSMRKAIKELPDGYEFQFPSDPKIIAMVAEWAAGERLCCPFFDIQLRMEAEGGPFWLRLTGRKGTKDFIKVDGASWVKP
jgi:hypothetical protein